MRADDKGPSYTYTADGKLATRTWERGTVTTYGYDALGQLTSVAYSDDTPSVTNTYDRLGRQVIAKTALAEHQFAYSSDCLSLNGEGTYKICY